MKLSGVLIVKNEEVMLSRCLDSIKGVDELVIVDTGSEDKTVEIAKKYTDKVYYFKWCDSFCKARNFANSKATGDWILTIDADEQLLTPMSKVKEIIVKTDKEVLGVTLVGGKGNKHQSPRLFRNKKDIYWKGDIHNYLNRLIEEDVDITIEYGYSPAHKKDPNRALRIAKKAVKKNPTLVRERYYLAREYFYRKMWQECIEELNRYIKVANWLPERNDAYLMKARCLAALEKYNEACDSAWEAIKYNANFKEALYFVGDHMDSVNKKVWHKFAEIANNDNVLFIRERVGEKGAEYYDRLFKDNKDMSRYEDIYKKVGQLTKGEKVLDIGCGLAQLSKYVKDYSGFDIASETIESLKGVNVWVGNALEKENYKEAEVYVCLEVLEHITKDKQVLELIPEGFRVIFSVPSFPDTSHVRTFTEDSVKERYKDLVEIENITYYTWNGKWTESKELKEPFILLVQGRKIS